MANASFQLAVSAPALSDDPRQAPRLARQLGFAGLQFPAVSAALDLTQLSGTGRREFRHVLSGADQQLVSLAADLGAKGFGLGADIDRLLARLDQILEAAKGLAASLVCIDLGPLPKAPRVARVNPKVTADMAGLLILPTFTAAPAPEAPNPPSAVDSTFAAQLDAALLDLGQRADRYGVTVALRSELSDCASLAQALRRASCPWFGIDLDPVAILRDEWEPDEVFSQLGSQISHVRGRDAAAGSGHRTKPAIIGQGSTDWAELLSRLDDAGYHGWITVDPVELPDRTAAASAGRVRIEKAR